jgi:hypothetical protein
MPISSALGSSALLPAGLGFRNKIINGAMSVCQRGTTPIANAANTNTYGGPDRWHIFGASASKMTITQTTTAPNNEGFSFSALVTSSAATTPASGDYYGVRQYIEGYNMADLAWGTAGAKPIVISFWVRSSIVGTYSFALFNASNTRTFVSTYTINTINTWEKKIVYVSAGETTGTWNASNDLGTSVWFDLGSGTGANTTANIWNTSLLIRTSGSVNWIGTSGATFYITGVQLEQNYQPTPFEQRPIGTELALCQRYYQRTIDTQGLGLIMVGGIESSTGAAVGCTLPVTMRATPSMSLGSGIRFYSAGSSTVTATIATNRSNASFGSAALNITSGTVGQSGYLYNNTAANSYIEFSAEL